MVLTTLQAMAKGGMHDQLGGGFHRYSVDEHWFVPHFEDAVRSGPACDFVSGRSRLRATRSTLTLARDIFRTCCQSGPSRRRALLPRRTPMAALPIPQNRSRGEALHLDL